MDDVVEEVDAKELYYTGGYYEIVNSCSGKGQTCKEDPAAF